MIVGVGIDLVAIARVRRLQERFGQRLAERLLARVEWDDYLAAADGARLLAKRFAAKEATVKALGTGMAQGIGFRDLWVTHDAIGAPALQWGGAARQRARDLGVAHVHLSLSDEDEHVVACVILEG